MNSSKIDGSAAYMMHDLGPRRFHPAPAWTKGWTATEFGKRLLDRMAGHGLDARDCDVSLEDARATVRTDAGHLVIEDGGLDENGEAIDRLFASVAAGIAQERMMRLAGWRPGRQVPRWAVTVSDALARLLRQGRATPSQLWNTAVNIDEDGWIDRSCICVEHEGYAGYDARSALLSGSYVARYGTGMHLDCTEGEIRYDENRHGATVTVPTHMLRSSRDEQIVDRPLSDALPIDGELARLLGGYRVTGAIAHPPRSDSLAPEPHRTELLLAVPMRTLEEVPPRAVLAAGIDVPAGVEHDRPLWMLTAEDDLLRYGPRRRR